MKRLNQTVHKILMFNRFRIVRYPPILLQSLQQMCVRLVEWFSFGKQTYNQPPFSIDFLKSYSTRGNTKLSSFLLFTILISSQLFISLTDNPYKWKTNRLKHFHNSISSWRENFTTTKSCYSYDFRSYKSHECKLQRNCCLFNDYMGLLLPLHECF